MADSLLFFVNNFYEIDLRSFEAFFLHTRRSLEFSPKGNINGSARHETKMMLIRAKGILFVTNPSKKSSLTR